MNPLQRVRNGSEQEGGFALIFVLFVTMVVTIGVTSALVVVAPNITKAKRAEDTASALAAAQAGVDDVIAYLVSIPSCRSETKICAAGLGASSTALAGTAKPRPTLGGSQSFSWTTEKDATPDGYLRVRSVGTSHEISKTLVADLSLRPSILAYGYYTDYEAQSPPFLKSYYKPRNIYISDSTIYGNVDSDYRGNTSAPRYANWKGTQDSALCGQHWYKESASIPGRASNGSKWSDVGTLGTAKSTTSGTTISRKGDCDLYFTSAMVEDGLTYTRDAILSTGAGPVFNKPVYTMWGYDDGTKVNKTPAPTAAQNYRGDPITNSPNLPAVAAADLVLPKTIGTDGLAENRCLYYGPTRVVLDGAGNALVTSPETTTKNADSDAGCYPTGTLPATGIVNFRVNYKTLGGGTIEVANLNSPPAGGWPDNPTIATKPAAANNEVLWIPAASTTTNPDASSSVAPATCGSATYSAAVSSPCAWTNLRSATDGGSTRGWTAFDTTSKCTTKAAATDRFLFECEYSQTTGATRPADQYAALRSTVQNALTGGTCVGGTIAVQAACVQNTLNTNVLTAGNTSRHAYNYATPATNDRQYYAVTTAGSSTSGTTQDVGSSPANPMSGDQLFKFTGTPARETATLTPLTTTVYRQTYANGKWGTGVPQFTFTITDTDWNVTSQPTGASYFPAVNDVTGYNTGVDSAGAVVGSTGTSQPGDLYVEGVNKGKLSLVADNDLIVTGNITNPSGSTASTDAVSMVATGDVRNYHPLACADQDTTDINNTTPGWCPNDISGINGTSMVDSNGFTSSHPARQYVNLAATGDRTIEAAIFALSGSLRTDNFDRAPWVGNLIVHGGIYQSARGGNGTFYGTNNNARTGTTLQYTYVDLQRAELPYVPPATSGNYSRPWNVVSLSAGS